MLVTPLVRGDKQRVLRVSEKQRAANHSPGRKSTTSYSRKIVPLRTAALIEHVLCTRDTYIREYRTYPRSPYLHAAPFLRLPPQVSSRAAAAAERRSRSLERRSAEAKRAAEAAESATVRSETARAEAERALAGFQASVARALGGVEDSLADALRGVAVGRGGGEGPYLAGEGAGLPQGAPQGKCVSRGVGLGGGGVGGGGVGVGGGGFVGTEGRHGWGRGSGLGGGSQGCSGFFRGGGGGSGAGGPRQLQGRQLGQFPSPPPPRWASHGGAFVDRTRTRTRTGTGEAGESCAANGEEKRRWLGVVAPVEADDGADDDDAGAGADADAAAAATAVAGRCVF